MITVDEALARVLAASPLLGSEQLPLRHTQGRVLAADAVSAHPQPLFTQSAVDGYAVRHAELAVLPCTLPLGTAIAARAHPAHPELSPGTATRVLTGGLLPLGADTVVRQEHTERHAEYVTIVKPVAAGADIRHCGEEMPAGQCVAQAGQTVTAGLLAALALAGVQTVSVQRLPKVVVLITGDEVVPAGAGPLKLGQVPDANGPLLQAVLGQWGIAPLRVEAVADTPEAVRTALNAALTEADLVLTTGGVSVGDHDYIPATAESLGAQRVLWKVAQKPGMPLYVAQRGQSLLFGLPGNPASVLVNLLVYVRAALDQMQGLDTSQRWHPGHCAQATPRDAHKTLWLRVVQQFDAQAQVVLTPLGAQASHMLGNLAQANALLRIEPASQTPPAALARWCRLP
jgi:molybdopterin molybdotransferase